MLLSFWGKGQWSRSPGPPSVVHTFSRTEQKWNIAKLVKIILIKIFLILWRNYSFYDVTTIYYRSSCHPFFRYLQKTSNHILQIDSYLRLVQMYAKCCMTYCISPKASDCVIAWAMVSMILITWTM